MSDFPEKIYLFGDGDDIVWCEDPAPSYEHNADDAVEYIRADKVKAEAIIILILCGKS